MKVLMLSWEYPPHIDGGLGQHVKELTPALLEADPNLVLHLVTPTFAGETTHEAAGAPGGASGAGVRTLGGSLLRGC